MAGPGAPAPKAFLTSEAQVTLRDSLDESGAQTQDGKCVGQKKHRSYPEGFEAIINAVQAVSVRDVADSIGRGVPATPMPRAAIAEKVKQ